MVKKNTLHKTAHTYRKHLQSCMRASDVSAAQRKGYALQVRAKETYLCVKRDLLMCQKRPTYVGGTAQGVCAAGTCKRQKRPTDMPKETY